MIKAAKYKKNKLITHFNLHNQTAHSTFAADFAQNEWKD